MKDAGEEFMKRVNHDVMMTKLAPGTKDFQNGYKKLMDLMVEYCEQMNLGPAESLTLTSAVPVGIVRDAMLQLGFPQGLIQQTFRVVSEDDEMSARMEKSKAADK